MRTGIRQDGLRSSCWTACRPAKPWRWTALALTDKAKVKLAKPDKDKPGKDKPTNGGQP